MKKRILSILLVIMMLVGMLPVNVFAVDSGIDIATGDTSSSSITMRFSNIHISAAGTATVTSNTETGKAGDALEATVQLEEAAETLTFTLTVIGKNATSAKNAYISYGDEAASKPTKADDGSYIWTKEITPVWDENGQMVVVFKIGALTKQAYSKTYTFTVKRSATDNTVAVESVAVAPETAEVEVGQTLELTATVLPENATNKTVTWTSSDESVATVANGIVTGMAAGDVTVTATAGGKSATCAVTVKETQQEGGAVTNVIDTTIGGTQTKPNDTVYVSSIVVGNAVTVKDYTVDGTAISVVLAENTAADAEFELTFAHENTMAGAFSMVYSGDLGTEGAGTVKLDNGSATVCVTSDATVVGNVAASAAWTLTFRTEGQAEPSVSYTVTLPADTTGYTVAAAEGSASPVAEGGSYRFTVTIAEGYEAGEGFAVKANDAALTAADGVYTIENITADQTVTVEGVEEKQPVVEGTPFSQNISVPANGRDRWGYVSGLTLSGTDGSVYEAYWSSVTDPFVLDVILGQDTDLGATITAAFTVGGNRAPSISGDTSVTLVNGKGTIQVTAKSGISAFYPDTTWTINLTVDDGSAANRPTHAVTLPTDAEGYTATAYNSESPVIEGRKFSFKVTIDNTHKAGESFAVKANGEVLEASDGIYTIENITEPQTVTVEGVVQKTLADDNVTVIAPAGSIISSGRHHTYFKYDFSEPLEETTLEDGRLQKIFPVVSGRQGFIRVQHPDGVTYWDFDCLSAGNVIEITEEMLFIGSTEFTKETVYDNFEKNVKDKADLYLTANEKGWLDLNTGDTWNLNVFRNFLSLGNTITNDCLALPDVEYKVVSVDGTPSSGVITVTPNENNNSYAEIKAVGAGTAIILVSYDAVYNCDGEGGQQWSAIWPENTGVIVVTVDAQDASIATNMTVNEQANSTGKQVIDAEHDILFYVGDSGASYSFKPEDGCTVTVNRSSVGSTMTFGGFSGSGVEVADDGTVTVTGLTTGAHIIKVEKGGQAVYQVVRARQVSYEVKHSDGSLVTEENPARPGDTVTIQFHGLISPMEKLSGVYNTNFAFYYIDEEGTNVSSTSSSGYGVYTFSGSPSLQKFTVTVPSYWNNTTYTLTDGGIKIGGFGSTAGSHRTTTYIAGKEVNTNASGVAGILSVLPDIVIDTAPCGYNSYNVTLPTGEGYTVTGGAVPVPEGETYTFTVTVENGYDSTNMVVKVNEKAVTGENGTYSVKNVSKDLTVTVEGVEKITVDMSNAVAVYTNGVDGTGWGRGERAYVDVISIGGAQVDSYTWDGNTCNVTLSSETAQNASVGFVITFNGSPASWVAKMSATLNGTAMTAGDPMVIKLVDGKATVEVSAAYNNSSKYGGTKTFVLTVAEKPVVNVESITLDQASAELEVGQSLSLTATVTPDNATDKTVTWTSSDEAVATVKDGKVTAVGVGIATITAATVDGNKTAQCLVGVVEPEFDIPADEIDGYVTVSFEDFGVRVEGEDIDPAYASPRGVIIPATKVPFKANDTVASVTLRLLDARGVKATYSGSEFSGFYLSAIDGFGEFDAGMGSGWMITLNDWFINKGASEFQVKDGDIVKWQYTCQLGKDIGDSSYYKSVEDVVKLIDAIGTVTPESEAAIEEARAAYNKLSAEERKRVSNYAELTAAEAALAALKKQNGEEDQTAAAGEDIYKTTGDYLEALGTPASGSVGGEWMVIGLVRSDRQVPGEDDYYASVVKFVQENIDENERLHSAKSTENSRIILALTAMGKDVTNVDGHNLLLGLTDLAYLQKQGINGPIWALIAFDSGNYPIPEGGDVTRQALIQVILEAQLTDGGWALSGSTSDPDMTGMALQALAPYYDSNAEVKKAVDTALIALSDMQQADGSFASIDGKNLESIAQVVTALAALGIDADEDSRFIKNGVSALDALSSFYVSGGGFRHTADGSLDGMATEQGYYALAAYYRMKDGKTGLYDMTDVVDMGGDPAEEEPAETPSVEITPTPTEPAGDEDDGKGSFPWWLVIVIAVLAGAIVVLVIVKTRKREE